MLVCLRELLPKLACCCVASAGIKPTETKLPANSSAWTGGFETPLETAVTECPLNGELHLLPSSQATAVQFSVGNGLG